MEQIEAIKAVAVNAGAYLASNWRLSVAAAFILWIAVTTIRMFFYRLGRGDGFFKSLFGALLCIAWPWMSLYREKQHDEGIRRRREGPPGNLTDRF